MIGEDSAGIRRIRPMQIEDIVPRQEQKECLKSSKEKFKSFFNEKIKLEIKEGFTGVIHTTPCKVPGLQGRRKR